MTSQVASVHPPSSTFTLPIRTALAPALPPDATLPMRILRTADGILAAYSPAQLDRDSAWQLLRAVFGDLLDITPASVTA